jgi:hypothetical protein
MAALNGRTHFDLIITSYGGPETDEKELLYQPRSIGYRRHMPVMLL